jgi:hypothetical protein
MSWMSAARNACSACPLAFHFTAWRATTLAACATARLWRQKAWRWVPVPGTAE